MQKRVKLMLGVVPGLAIRGIAICSARVDKNPEILPGHDDVFLWIGWKTMQPGQQIVDVASNGKTVKKLGRYVKKKALMT